MSTTMAQDFVASQDDLLTKMLAGGGNSDDQLNMDMMTAAATTMASTMTAAPSMAAATSVGTLPCFKDLFAVLFECFSIISLGYLSCRFKLVSPEAKDLGAYLTTFALPMIIFLNIAQMEFQSINLSFLFSMLVAKLFLFIVVTLLTLATSYPTNSGYAGALSILATQSNDFALGYPLIKSLYGESKPEMLSYLSLMAPIQLLILNPLGIIMLEYEKSKQNKSETNESSSSSSTGPCGLCLRSQEQISAAPQTHSSLSSSSSPNESSPPPAAAVANDCHDDDDKTSRFNRQIRSDGANGDNYENQPPTNNEDLLTTSSAHNQHNSGVIRAKQNNENTKLAATGVDDHPHDNDDHQSKRQSGIRRTKLAIKPLALVLPARSIAIECGSDSSIDTLNSESFDKVSTNLYDYGPQISPKFSLSSPFEQQAYPQQTHTNINLVRDQSTKPKLLYVSTPLTIHTLGGGSNNNATNTSLDCGCTCGRARGKALVNLSFLKALATNPLIIASVVALAVNLLHGPELPKLVTKVSNTIAASFAAPALFVVGLSMYGKFELLLRSPHDLLLSSILVVTKVLILPSIMRTVALVVLPYYVSTDEVTILTDFSYLYGLLPTAPTACIIANQYGVLTNVVSISMLLSTFISAPLMLATSVIINQSSTIPTNVIQNVLAQTLKSASVLTLVLSLITMWLLWKANRRISYMNLFNSQEILCRAINRVRTNSTHLFTILLVLTQLIIGIGGFLWFFVDTSKLGISETSSATASGDHYHHHVHQQQASSHQHPDDVGLVMNDDVTTAATTIRTRHSHPHSNSIFRHSGLLIAPTSMGFGFEALCTMQYIFSSGGLIMSRFVISSVVVITVAQMIRGHVISNKLTTLMMRVYPLLGVGTVVWLVVESQHLKCQPSEASLPSWPMAQWLRLIYNLALLITVVPLFSIMFRTENKSSWLSRRQVVAAAVAESIPSGRVGGDNHQSPSHPSSLAHHHRRRGHLTSSVSLSSDASSAVTINTNLDSTPAPVGGGGPPRKCQISNISDTNQTPTQQQQCDSVLVLDCKGLNEANKMRESASNNNSCAIRHVNDPDPTGDVVIVDDPIVESYNPSSDNNNNISNTLSASDIHRACEYSIPPNQADFNQHQSNEFNKYSILIVFMLIQVVLNLTTLIQMLNHERPFGTFRQVEIATIALDFGQGLLTFLVLGILWFPANLISIGTICKT